MSENAKQARAALQTGRHGSLATVDFETHGPYVALANYACDVQGLPIFLFSKLARHTKSLLADPRASLLVADIPPMGDALTGFRATFMGLMEPAKAEEVSALYIARHPYAAGYATFADFSFWRLAPELVHVVGGFGRIETLNAKDVF